MRTGLPNQRGHTSAAHQILRVNRGDSTQTSKLTPCVCKVRFSRGGSRQINDATTNKTTDLENTWLKIEVAVAGKRPDYTWLGIHVLSYVDCDTIVSRTIK